MTNNKNKPIYIERNGDLQTVHACSGAGGSLAAAVRDLVSCHPQIVWREPVPLRNRISNPEFVGLWTPADNAPEETLANCMGMALDGARLFWCATETTVPVVVHLVSAAYGHAKATKSRWAAFWIDQDKKSQPEWLKQRLARQKCSVPPGEWKCWSSRQDLLSICDNQRYGLPGSVVSTGCRTMHAIMYYCGDRLVLWRLEPNGSRPSTQSEGVRP
jgi:hypothetical protein